MVNPVDRVIEFFAPERAVARAGARATMELVRAYDAAKTGRRTDGWHTSGSSANAEIASAGARIANRSRDHVRNNPWAATARRKIPAKVVGTGIIPFPSLGKGQKEARKRATGIWESFVENSDPEGQLDLYGQMNLACATWFEGGEGLVRLIPRPSSWRLPIPFQVQVLEGDYLDRSKTLALEDDGVIIQGVQYDKFGRRTGYWMFDEHPGDIYVSIGRAARLRSQFVPAWQILHIFDPLRAGQVRGVSMFAPVAISMRDLGDADDAEIALRKIRACMGVWVKSPAAGASSTLAGSTTDEKGRRIEGWSPGMVRYMRPGEEPVFNQMPGGDNDIQWQKMQLHAIAAGLGCTYEMLTGDLSGTNLSSIRAGMLDEWELIDGWQWRMMIPQFCRPIWQRVGQFAYATGQWNDPTTWKAVYATPRRRLLDPEKDVNAALALVRGGFSSMPRQIQEFGESPELILEEVVDWNQQLDDGEVILDSDPRKVGKTSTPRVAADNTGTTKDTPDA